MSQRTQILIAAAAAVVLVGTVWFLTMGNDSQAVPSVQQASEIAQSTPARDRSSGTEPLGTSTTEAVPLDAPTVASLAPNRPWPPGVTEVSLSGRVVDERGHPWPGATVVFAPDRRTRDELEADPSSSTVPAHAPHAELPRTLTDASGRFELRGPWYERELGTSWRSSDADPSIAITAQGMAWQGHPALGFDGEAMDLGDLVLAHPGASISLRVVDERGEPVPDVLAQVTSRSYQSAADDDPSPPGFMTLRALGVTDADGRLRDAHRWPSRMNVSFSKAGFVTQHLRVELPAGEHADLDDVVMTKGFAVAGVVLDDHGAPLADVHITALASTLAERALDKAPGEIDLTNVVLRFARDSPLTTRTDSDGTFELGGLSHDMDAVSLFAMAPGFDIKHVQSIAPSTTHIDIRLLPEARLNVDVRRASDGEPITDAELIAVARTGFREEPFPAFLENAFTPLAVDDGRVVHRPGRLGTVVFVSAPGCIPQRVDVEPCQPGEHRDIVVTLGPGEPVTGRVVDEKGDPVAGAEVWLSTEWDIFDDFLEFEQQLTTNDGRFTFEALDAGVWSLGVFKHGYPRFELKGIDSTSPATEIEVVLTRGADIVGTIIDADGTPAVAHRIDATLVPNAASAKSGVTTSMPTRSDRLGRFAFHGLKPGAWVLRAKPGVERHITVEAREELDVQLQLAPTLTLTGRTLTGQDPLPQVRVIASTDPKGLGNSVSTRSDGKGVFRLALPGADTYQIFLISRSNVWERRQVVAEEGDAPHLQVDFGTAHLTGRVTMSDPSRPLPEDTSIYVTRFDEHRGYIRPDANGHFSYGPLTPGSYTLMCNQSMSLPIRHGPVDVSAGETIDGISLVLHPAARVRGVIHLDAGDDFTGFAHLRRTDGIAGYRVEQVYNNTFEFEQVEPGSWSLDLATFRQAELGLGDGLRGEPGIELPALAEQQRFEVTALQDVKLNVHASTQDG